VALALTVGVRPASADTLTVPSEDYATIQSALDDAVMDDIIEVLPGTYEESLVATGLDNVTIHGKGKVIIRPGPGNGLALDNSTDISIAGLAFRDTGGSCIVLDTCTRIAVEKIAAASEPEGDFVDTVVTVVDSTEVTIRGLNVTGASLGVSIEDSSDVEVSGCRFRAVNLGVLAFPDEGACSNIRVLANKMGPGSLALQEDDFDFDCGADLEADRSLVARNTITKPLTEGIRTRGVQNAVTHNKVTLPTFCGIAVGVNGASAKGAGGSLVAHNRISNPGGDGIIVLDGPRTQVLSNSVSGFFRAKDFFGDLEISGGIGIQIDSDASGSTVGHNKIRSSFACGIVVDADDCIVIGNTVTKPGFRGEEGIEEAEGVLVQGLRAMVVLNKITSALEWGIAVFANDATVLANTASKSVEADLFINSGVVGTVLGDNKFGTVVDEGP
jgi:hypothetical protein